MTYKVIEVVKGIDKSPHPHAANIEAVVKIKASLKRRAEEHPKAPPAQLIRTELQNVTGGVLSQLPERPNLTKIIQRSRLKNMPTNPRSLEE